MTGETNLRAEESLHEALKANDLTNIKLIFRDNPKININCYDKDGLTPLHLSVHKGNYEISKYLLEIGADPNFPERKDNYTALMFASIGGRNDIVRLLLENDSDINLENRVNRNAAQMAAFVGQYKSVAIISHWVPYSLVEPYTKCRELEDKPRLSSTALGHTLHSYIVNPSIHPIKIILFIQNNLKLISENKSINYVLENLLAKSVKSPMNDEVLAFKLHYLTWMLDFCCKLIEKGKSIANESQPENCLHIPDQDQTYMRGVLENFVKRLVKKEDPSDSRPCTVQTNKLIIECITQFPYKQLNIFKTVACALTRTGKEQVSALHVLNQALNGPRAFGYQDETCSVCSEVCKTKKCSLCKCTYYCSPECQKTDWFQHKKACKQLKS